MCISVFGTDVQRVGVDNAPLGKNLAEGDGMAMSQGSDAQELAQEMQQFVQQNTGHEDESKAPSAMEESKRLEVGYPPKSIPKHGPGYLSLSGEDREWIKRVHHKMGHPDPQRLARFLQSTHAKSDIISGAMDFQCDACVESQRGFQSTRPAGIHDNIGFNEVVGMDVAYWTGRSGVRYPFVHFLDEGTLFHQARPCSESSAAQFAAFEMAWLSWAGPPKEMYFDPATEYVALRRSF